MVYTYTDSNNGNPQKNYVIEYNPKTSGVKAIAMYGEYEFGGDPISENVRLAQSRGHTVIAGVNASPFDTSNGVTVGTIISEGRIVSANSGVSGYDSFAIRNDGTMFIGRSNLSFSYKTSKGNVIEFYNNENNGGLSNIYTSQLKGAGGVGSRINFLNEIASDYSKIRLSGFTGTIELTGVPVAYSGGGYLKMARTPYDASIKWGLLSFKVAKDNVYRLLLNNGKTADSDEVNTEYVPLAKWTISSVNKLSGDIIRD